MATPTRSRHVLPGVLGELFVDVRAAGRDAGRPAVVLVHGFKGFKDWGFFPPFADRLARAGFFTVSFNMSGSGVDAEGEPTLGSRFTGNTYSAELADLATVVDALMDGALGVAPPTTLGIVGHSRGGGVAILHTANDPRVRALVTWAAIADVNRWGPETWRRWRAAGSLNVTNARTGQVLPLSTAVLDDVEAHPARLDLLAAAARVACPWLVVHGAQDETVAPADAERLAAASGRADTQLLILEHTGHTFGAAHPWKPPVPTAERVFSETSGFLAAALAGNRPA